MDALVRAQGGAQVDKSKAGSNSASPTAAGQRQDGPALIGRHQELENAIRALDQAPSVVIIEGDAGIGKTRLIQETLAAANDSRTILMGVCQPLKKPFTFGPVVDALRQLDADQVNRRDLSPLAGTLRPLLPELAHILPPPPEPLADRRAERHRIFRGIKELLDVITAPVLVLEDMHWADRATGEFLFSLADGFPQSLTLMLTYRRGNLPEWSQLVDLPSRIPTSVSASNLYLTPFDSVADVRDLIAGLLGDAAISDEFATYIQRQTGGIPFAIEELIGLLRERGDITLRSGRWIRRRLEELDAPVATRGSILQRIRALDNHARGVLKAAAVIGLTVEEDVLLDVIRNDVDDLSSALVQIADSGVLVETSPGLWTFRHWLARRAIYESMPSLVRRELHKKTVEVLERIQPPSAIDLAYHSKHSGLNDKWAAYSEAAADLALSTGDDATASDYLLEALSAPSLRRRARIRVALKLGAAAYDALEHSDAITVIQRLLEDAELTKEARGELRYSLARLLTLEGHNTEANDEFKRSIDELSKRPDLRSRAMSKLAVPIGWDLSARDHLRWARLGFATARDIKDPAVRLSVMGDHASALLYLGHPTAREAAEVMPDVATDAGEAKELFRTGLNLAGAAYYLGNNAEARRYLLEATGTSHVVNYLVQSLEVLLDWSEGRWEGLEQRAQNELQADPAASAYDGDPHLVLGSLLLARARVREAKGHFRIAFEAGRSIGWLPWMLTAASGLARMTMVADGGATIPELDEALDRTRTKGVWIWAGEATALAVSGHLGRGDTTDATKLLHDLESGIHNRMAPLARAYAQICHGLIDESTGGFAGAARWFRRAQRQFTTCDRRYALLLAKEMEARCWFAANDPRGAAAGIEALDGLDDLGATWDASRLRALLRNAGISQAFKGGPRGYGSELSPREHEVVSLVEQGLTNRQIADELFISYWTIIKQVSTAMKKQGVTSRTELSTTRDRVNPPD